MTLLLVSTDAISCPGDGAKPIVGSENEPPHAHSRFLGEAEISDLASLAEAPVAKKFRHGRGLPPGVSQPRKSESKPILLH